MTVLKMATRGSALALAQSMSVARVLELLRPGLRVETLVVKTSGDRFGAPPPETVRALTQGAKGLWVLEIEEALRDGRADFAVHSAKDLPAAPAAGLSVAAYPEREDPRDALVARPGLTWAALAAGARVATSSLRRRLMVAAAKPGTVFLPLRGNVDTRLRRLRDGEFDATILAVAGLKRLAAGTPHEPLAEADVLPAPGQGALALEIRADRPDVAGVVGALDHAPTRRAVEFERAFLAAVGGGCGAPVGARASLLPDGRARLEGFFAREGESSGRRVSGVSAGPERDAGLAAELAARAAA